MTAPTLAPAVEPVDIDTFPHQPWCVEHWYDDAVCWARDLVLQVRPAGCDDGGQVTVVMSHGTRDAESVNITVFTDTVLDGESSVQFDPDEAEVTAHALLFAASLARGESSAAEWHRTTAEQKAAALLARRTGGAR